MNRDTEILSLLHFPFPKKHYISKMKMFTPYLQMYRIINKMYIR